MTYQYVVLYLQKQKSTFCLTVRSGIEQRIADGSLLHMRVMVNTFTNLTAGFGILVIFKTIFVCSGV